MRACLASSLNLGAPRAICRRRHRRVRHPTDCQYAQRIEQSTAVYRLPFALSRRPSPFRIPSPSFLHLPSPSLTFPHLPSPSLTFPHLLSPSCDLSFDSVAEPCLTSLVGVLACCQDAIVAGMAFYGLPQPPTAADAPFDSRFRSRLVSLRTASCHRRHTPRAPDAALAVAASRRHRTDAAAATCHRTARAWRRRLLCRPVRNDRRVTTSALSTIMQPPCDHRLLSRPVRSPSATSHLCARHAWPGYQVQAASPDLVTSRVALPADTRRSYPRSPLRRYASYCAITLTKPRPSSCR